MDFARIPPRAAGAVSKLFSRTGAMFSSVVADQHKSAGVWRLVLGEHHLLSSGFKSVSFPTCLRGFGVGVTMITMS